MKTFDISLSREQIDAILAALRLTHIPMAEPFEDDLALADHIEAVTSGPTVVLYHDLMLEHGNFHAAEQDLIGRASRGEKVWMKCDLVRFNQSPPPSLVSLCDRVILVYAGGTEKIIHDRDWTGVGSYQQGAG